MPLLAQMMRLKRELDRVTEERDRARDDSKKAEQARQQLEMELKVSQADPGIGWSSNILADGDGAQRVAIKN